MTLHSYGVWQRKPESKAPLQPARQWPACQSESKSSGGCLKFLVPGDKNNCRDLCHGDTFATCITQAVHAVHFRSPGSKVATFQSASSSRSKLPQPPVESRNFPFQSTSSARTALTIPQLQRARGTGGHWPPMSGKWKGGPSTFAGLSTPNISKYPARKLRSAGPEGCNPPTNCFLVRFAFAATYAFGNPPGALSSDQR